MFLHVPGDGRREAGEPGGELHAEHVHVLRPPVVTERPDDLHILSLAGDEHRSEGAEIETIRPCYQGPANSVADCPDPHAPAEAVIVFDLPVVLGRRDHIQPNAGTVNVTGRLESPHPERVEETTRRRADAFRPHWRTLPAATGSSTWNTA